MPRKKHAFEAYECYRCGYTSTIKKSMRDHLTKRKKTCPPSKHEVDLSPEIINKILDNRVYRPPAPALEPAPVAIPAMATTINNNQIINNFNTVTNNQLNTLNTLNMINQYYGSQTSAISNLNRIDTHHKLTKFLEYKGLRPMDIQDVIEDRFEEPIDRLDNATSSDFKQTMKKDDFYKAILNTMRVKPNCLDQMSVILDKSRLTMKIFYLGEWEEYMVDTGMDTVVKYLAYYYLSYYEMYLIRGLERPLNRYHIQFRDCLNEYYNFISCFNVDCSVFDVNDDRITDKPEDANSRVLVNKYCDLKDHIKDRLKDRHIRETRAQVLKIIASSMKHNIEDLNRHVLDILQADSAFMRQLDVVPVAISDATSSDIEDDD